MNITRRGFMRALGFGAVASAGAIMLPEVKAELVQQQLPHNTWRSSDFEWIHLSARPNAPIRLRPGFRNATPEEVASAMKNGFKL